jgi:nucleotide-binding universal stress UspA family protein
LVDNVPTSRDERGAFSALDEEVLQLARWAVAIEDHYSEKRGARTFMDIEWAKDGVSEELHLVHAWQAPLARGYAAPTEEYLSRLYAERAWELLEDQAERIRNSGVEIAGAHRRLGSPVDEVVELAGELDVDLVLVGSRGLGYGKAAGPGQRLRRRGASCPVPVGSCGSGRVSRK